MVKLAICISHTQAWTYAAFTKSFGFMMAEMVKLKAEGIIKSCNSFWGTLFPIDANRNALVKAVLKTDATHLMWFDTDQTFPSDCVRRLLSHDKDMVGGIYFKKAFPFYSVPMVARETKFYKGEYTIYNPVVIRPDNKRLIAVDATGMGCTLVKRQVFEKLKHPWFEYRWSEQSGEKTISEEMKFFEDAKKAGIQLWIDEGVRCGHLSPIAYGIDDHVFGCEEHDKEYAAKQINKQIEALVRPDRED